MGAFHLACDVVHLPVRAAAGIVEEPLIFDITATPSVPGPRDSRQAQQRN